MTEDRIQITLDGMTEKERETTYFKVGESLQDIAVVVTNALQNAFTSTENKTIGQDADSDKIVISELECFNNDTQEFICVSPG